MKIRNPITRSLLLAALVATVANCGTPRRAAALALRDPCSATLSENNSIEAHEYHLTGARVPGQLSTRQDVTAWQVTQGTWNGQTLNGLCLVMVQSTAEDGHTPRQTNCYVSQLATPAQREALLGAFLAGKPQGVCADAAHTLRLEPAVISLEIDGHSVLLHLGLVA